LYVFTFSLVSIYFLISLLTSSFTQWLFKTAWLFLFLFCFYYVFLL
jgi:hypothetical protein